MVLTDERTAAHGGDRAAVPPARRFRRARWANPQLIGGALMVLICVAVGARVIAAADDTVPVLVAAGDIGAGQEVTADLVRMHGVQLGSELDRYLTGDIGDGYVVTRDVSAGELLPRSAVRRAEEVAVDVRYIAIAVPSAELPDGLAAGSALDVWIASPGGGDAERLASGVRVTAISGRSAGALGVDGTAVSVTLAMTESSVDDGPSLDALLGDLVSAGRDGRVYLTRLPAEGR